MSRPTIPERMLPGLLRYIEHGILPGEFLRAVISNDLRQAVCRADDENRYLLRDYLSWLYTEAPADCHGSVDKMHAWAALGGSSGLRRRQLGTASSEGVQ